MSENKTPELTERQQMDIEIIEITTKLVAYYKHLTIRANDKQHGVVYEKTMDLLYKTGEQMEHIARDAGCDVDNDKPKTVKGFIGKILNKNVH